MVNINVILEIILGFGVIFFVFITAIYASLETALTSINLIRFKTKLKKWNYKKVGKKMKIIKSLIYNFGTTISTIAIAENISVLIASTLGGIFFTTMLNNADIGGLVSLIVLTFVLIIFSQILPKHFARNYPEFFTLKFYVFIYIGQAIFFPILYITKKVLITKVYKTATEKELKELVIKIKNEGVLDEEEKTLIINAIDFDDRIVEEAYVPWENIKFEYDYNYNYKNMLNLFQNYHYTMIPIISKNKKPLGVINLNYYIKKVIPKINKKNNNASKEIIPLKDIINFCPVVYKKTYLADALNKIRCTKAKCAFVCEKKKNNIVGMIFTSDLVAEIFGDFYFNNLYYNQYAQIGYKEYIAKPSCKIGILLDFINNKKMPIKNRNKQLIDWIYSINNKKKLEKDKILKYKNLDIQIIYSYEGKIIYKIYKNNII